MSTSAITALVAAGVAVVAYEVHVANQRKRATPPQQVQIVTPAGPRWWERALNTIAAWVLVAVLLVLALRYMPRGQDGGTADDPTATDTPTPSTSTSSTPDGASR